MAKANNANKQLMQAAYDGNLSAVEEALKNGADVKERDEEHYGDAALNQAAAQGHLDVVKRLVEAGADIENKGGADLTPVMNAAVAGHVNVVKFLIEKGAVVSNDLLSSVQMKVNIFEENAEAGMVKPEAVDAWKGFLDFLVTARTKQDMPEIVKALSSGDADDRKAALESIANAANKGIDISPALPRLREFVSGKDEEMKNIAAEALTTHSVQAGDWNSVRGFFESGDEAIKKGAMSVVVSAAQGGFDVLPIMPSLVKLLSDSALTFRHDGAIAIGYAATNGLDVSGTVPNLVKLLSDAESPAREMGCWALYRMAKYVCDISAAVPALKALQSDENERVRTMAESALTMAESRGK